MLRHSAAPDDLARVAALGRLVRDARGRPRRLDAWLSVSRQWCPADHRLRSQPGIALLPALQPVGRLVEGLGVVSVRRLLNTGVPMPLRFRAERLGTATQACQALEESTDLLPG